MNKKKVFKIAGIGVLVFALTANLQYAFFNYGVGKHSLGLAIIAQTSGTGGDATSSDDDPNDPWVYSMPPDVEDGDGTDFGSENGGDGYELRNPWCLKNPAVQIKFPIKQSQLTIALGRKFKCKSHSGHNCDATKQTNCQ